MDQNIATFVKGKDWTPANCLHTIIQINPLPVKMAAGVSWRYQEADPLVPVRRCLYCKVLLPSEPANDTAETATEVLGVEIALMTDEERESLLGVDQFFAFGEGFGDDGSDFPDQSQYTPDEQAAWFAAQIIQHEIEGDPK